MKNLIKSITLTIVLISLLSFSFQKDDNKVYYDVNRPLTWADFKGKPNNNVSPKAQTETNKEFGFTSKDNEATITLNRYFDKTKSWVKPDGKTDYLLKHEQGHFDISEIYFRKLVKEVKEYKFNSKTFTDDFKKLFTSNSDALRKQQDLYDKETNHSIIDLKQKEWNERIARELKEFEPYQNTKIAVHLN